MLEEPTFTVVADRIAPAQNKYMGTVYNNTAAHLIKVHRIWCFNWQVAASTGVLVEHEVRDISARTGGTAITPLKRRRSNTLPTGIIAETGSTGVTEVAGGLRRRFFGANEEVKLGALTLENCMNDANGVGSLVFWGGPAPIEPIYLENGQGVTLKCITSTTVATLSYLFECTVVLA